LSRDGALDDVRKIWADTNNEMMAGKAPPIDHRSLADQGSAALPTLHEGAAGRAAQMRGATLRSETKTQATSGRIVRWQEIDAGRTRAETNAQIRRINELTRDLEEQENGFSADSGQPSQKDRGDAAADRGAGEAYQVSSIGAEWDSIGDAAIDGNGAITDFRAAFDEPSGNFESSNDPRKSSKGIRFAVVANDARANLPSGDSDFVRRRRRKHKPKPIRRPLSLDRLERHLYDLLGSLRNRAASLALFALDWSRIRLRPGPSAPTARAPQTPTSKERSERER
jgi:hypothetical protein